jgi:hypothetical protein
MRTIESPHPYHKQPGEFSVFLAGGITGCPDWQQEIASLLKDTDLLVLNPRRKEFPMNDDQAARIQIKWEYQHLRAADAILFWFPKESVCPIALYELGAWSMTNKTIFVGVHPDYERRLDIEIQIGLRKPGVGIVYSLSELADQIRVFAKNPSQAKKELKVAGDP